MHKRATTDGERINEKDGLIDWSQFSESDLKLFRSRIMATAAILRERKEAIAARKAQEAREQKSPTTGADEP